MSGVFLFSLGDPTAPGEEVKMDCNLIRKSERRAAPELPQASTECNCCPFYLTVLADDSDDDELRNDKTSYYYKQQTALVSAVELTLQKHDCEEWQDITVLSDNTLGILYSYGFLEDDYGNSYGGYLIDWGKVLAGTVEGTGEGYYRIKEAAADIFGDVTYNYSLEYCLKEYTAERAQGTIRWEVNNTGFKGSIIQGEKILYDGWYNSIRLEGYVGFNEGRYTREFIEYIDRSLKQFENTQTEFYQMELKPVPAAIHDILKTEFFQADSQMLTDYNSENPNIHVQTKVKPEGNYKPEWEKFIKNRLKLAPVALEFSDYFNSRRDECC